MAIPEHSPKHLPDPNLLAASILAEATGSAKAEREKYPAAVALRRMGGLGGGKARAAKFRAKQRSQIAKGAARARWAIKPE